MSKEAEKVVQLYAGLFKGTIAISTLVASITFQVIIQQIEKPDVDFSLEHRIDYKDARSFLAIAWTLCISALGIACISYAVLTLNKERVVEMLETQNKDWTYYVYVFAGAIASILCQFLLLSAFLMCSMAVSAYSEKAGWTAAGVIIILMIAAVILWPWQLW